MENDYRLKKVKYFGKTLQIILQSKNGPCPLLAIANILVLQGALTLHEDLSYISHEDLISRVGMQLLEKNALMEGELMYENKKKRLDDAISTLPKLQVGLDVNVQFSDVFDFEYTSELEVFDMLGIMLTHGWVYNPNSPEATAIGNLSYNQLQITLIQHEESKQSAPDSPEAEKGGVILKFMENSASQLTERGLELIHAKFTERQLGVFFRNNHFSTILKHEACVFLLATDLGFKDEPRIIWEKINEISGNTTYCDCNFQEVTISEEEARAKITFEEQLAIENFVAQSKGISQDEEIARKAQQEYDAQLASQLEAQLAHEVYLEEISQANQYQREQREPVQSADRSSQVVVPRQGASGRSVRPAEPGRPEGKGKKPKSSCCSIQ